MAEEEGQHERARALHEEALGLWRQMEDRKGSVMALSGLGEVALRQGRFTDAQGYFHESLVLARATGDRHAIIQALESCARLAASRSQPDRALRLAAAAASQREAIGLPLSPTELGRLARGLEAARRRLGKPAAASLWAEGQVLALERAIAEAIDDPRADKRERAGEGAAPGGLTRREREVVALIARGLTNREIAEELVITERTAEIHVSNILGKLGLSSRTQVASWAFETKVQSP